MSHATHFIQFSPIFPVTDLERALAHYASLGFITHAYGAEYGYADRDGLSLRLTTTAGPRGEGSGAYLLVDDVDALYAAWSRPGIGGVTRHVRETAYELREGAHIDPDGNVIRFGSPATGARTERLRSHLQSRYDIEISRLVELDVGVFRVERDDGPSWVARLFPPSVPLQAVAGDGEILAFLAAHDFPAERRATTEPVSVLERNGLLVTGHVDAVPRGERRAAIRDAGGLRHLGELLGRLHTLPETAGAPARPGGAWHHLATGGPHDEIAAATTMLAGADGLVPPELRGLYEAMLVEIESLDACDDLPKAFIHPDFVLANVIAAPDRGMVLVDWAGAGHGARLWALAWLLFAEGAKDLRRIDLVIAGYRHHVDLDAEELARLGSVARARWSVLKAWEFCMGRKSLADAAREIAEARDLAAAVASRARTALRGSST